MTRILSIAVLSLGLLGGAAIAEPFDSNSYVPAASTDYFGSRDIGALRSDQAMQPATSTGSTKTTVDCGQSSKEGGAEPSAVDAFSPSNGVC